MDEQKWGYGMQYNAQEFGRRVQALRREQEITQEKMAEDLHLAKNSVSRIERGERSCSIDLMVGLAEYLHTTTDYLLTGKHPVRIVIENFQKSGS